MPFQVSPAVNVTEIDIATVIPAVATSRAALAGVFRWGPIGIRQLHDTESRLVADRGKPTNLNGETWFTVASYLAYANEIETSRAANTTGTSPIVTATVTAANAGLVVASTTSLNAGMSVIATTNSAVKVGATIAAITNATHFTLTTASDALASGSADIQFVPNTAFSAFSNTGSVANLAAQIVKNEDHFETIDGTFDSDVKFVARYPGELGNSLRVSLVANSDGYGSNLSLGNTSLFPSANIDFAMNVNSNTATFTIETSSNTTATSNANVLIGKLNVTDKLVLGNTQIGTQYNKIITISNVSLNASSNSTYGLGYVTVTFEDPLKLRANVEIDGASTTQNTIQRYWEFFNVVDRTVGQSDYNLSFGNTSINSDEMHVVVVDEGGKFTGVPGTVLERFESVSRGTDSKRIDGSANYWKTVINQQSQYIWAVNDISGAASATAENLVSSTLGVSNQPFNYGKDGADETNIAFGLIADAWDLFASAEEVDISFLVSGKNNDFQLGNYLIDNIAERRKDCVAWVSPQKGHVVNNVGNETAAVIGHRNNMRSSSYAFLDSGYKYMYDRYNDINRWIPLNGDMAGLAARTDQTNDAWWSPAGFNRGHIKNVIKLAWNPNKAQRDLLYPAGVNPVVAFPGQGTILFGDKTLLAKPSAFDRINVRRLFIILEKAISTAAKYTLFEFNDDFTRSGFRTTTNPYLRGIQGRRGITEFLVVCDTSNNGPEVINTNNFVGDIYIKPARSINFIQLNFVAVPDGVSFSEKVIGRSIPVA